MNIPINNHAPAIATNQIFINAPVDTVWKILTDINNWTSWQKDVTRAVVRGNVQEGALFEWKAGGLSFKSKIHTSKPMSMFGWTGTTIGASAIHNWFFESVHNGTQVKVEESLQGIFPKLLSKYFQKNLNSGVIKNLEELKAAAESR
ncbi:MAG: SRPBCC family protein [Chitinophagaceae bacterium]|nr:SRPBCC family protein [Chitinophagaceae bacterium]MCW5914530.1 SRPBCC family protein [Chitinophagaceae bacterium]MCZ2395367.1 SRPBCC family protein [Chitinophagales bacterium]